MAIINHLDLSTSGFDDDELTTSKSHDEVINFGDLTTTGDLADGIFADADNVLIQNFAQIETFGLGARGIFVQGNDARLDNHGSIVTHGDNYPAATDIDAGYSEAMLVEGDRFYIANYGTIETEGDGASAMIGFGADGVIINFGRVISSTTEGTIALYAIGDGSHVVNAGQITLGGLFTAALRVEGDETSALNRGQILITGEGGVGIAGAGFDTLTNKGVIVANADSSAGILAFGDSNQIENTGLIETHGSFTFGIVARGAGSVLGINNEITNGGSIVTDGDLAISIALGIRSSGFRPAADGEIVNSGEISTHGDGAAGVVMAGDGHHLTNSGTITTNGGAFDAGPLGILHAAGVVVVGNGALVENARTGTIQSLDAASPALELNVIERPSQPAADMSSTLENFGLIQGASVAIRGGAGQEIVINHGNIVGDVILGDGADMFVFGKGGILVDNLLLGDGHDLARVENGSGTSRIADFKTSGASSDVADVSAFFSSFNQLTAQSQQHGNDVVITLDHHNDVLILGSVQLSALNPDNFIFGAPI